MGLLIVIEVNFFSPLILEISYSFTLRLLCVPNLQEIDQVIYIGTSVFVCSWTEINTDDKMQQTGEDANAKDSQRSQRKLAAAFRIQVGIKAISLWKEIILLMFPFNQTMDTFPAQFVKFE